MTIQTEQKLGDLISITTHDGKSTFFPSEDQVLIAYGGFGMPPISFQTRQGYRQHGVTEVSYTLDVRHITMHIHRNGACSRQVFWDNRKQLHDYLRPNRNGPLTITVRTPNGAKRSIIARANPGMLFPATPDINNFDADEEIELLAFDPIWYDPTPTILTITAGIGGDLAFPISFSPSLNEIKFGVNGLLCQANITYQGTWIEYPTLTLTGPYNNASIYNPTTGFGIYLNISTIANEQRIITLTPGQQSIVDQNGNNKFGDLAPNSDLVDFGINPDPESPGGVQAIQAIFNGGVAGSSQFKVQYYNRYIAI